MFGLTGSKVDSISFYEEEIKVNFKFINTDEFLVILYHISTVERLQLHNLFLVFCILSCFGCSSLEFEDRAGSRKTKITSCTESLFCCLQMST